MTIPQKESIHLLRPNSNRNWPNTNLNQELERRQRIEERELFEEEEEQDEEEEEIPVLVPIPKQVQMKWQFLQKLQCISNKRPEVGPEKIGYKANFRMVPISLF